MRFGFVENRYKTYFWEAVARCLIDAGHQVFWLVQNPEFQPTVGSVRVVPFPRAADLCPAGLGFEFIKAADRNIKYFGGADTHYEYYAQIISSWLDDVSPDVIVGESTLFHELIVIEICRKRQIPYLHPSMPGYPGGRFSFYSYDTKLPLGQSGASPSDEQCLAIAEAIRKREKVPDYMLPVSGREPDRSFPMPRSAQDRLKIIRGYIRGERFNTPSPMRKWLLERSLRRRVDRWLKVENQKPLSAALEVQGRLLLYPLQMQPEANLDVWGQRHQDQARVISELADSLPDNWALMVKANPKAKYEMTDDLIRIVETHPKVFPVPLNAQMGPVLERAHLVCTVTGTIAVEAALSRKPIVQLGPSLVQDSHGALRISAPAEIVKTVQRMEDGTFPQASDGDRINLVRVLHATSFAGKVSDPVNMPSVMSAENVAAVTGALVQISAQAV